MKINSARLTSLALGAGTVLLAGCSILAPQPDPSRFFVLAPLANAAARTSGTEAEPLASAVLGVGPIKLPPYLDRNAMAIRVSPTQITYSSLDLWAEPLDVNVAHVLLQNLSALLGTERILMYPWPIATKVNYQVEVQVLRLDASSSGEAQLTARWSIKEGSTQRYVAVRETNVTHPAASADVAASVAALSAAVGDLSEEIATTVRHLPQPEQPATSRGKRP